MSPSTVSPEIRVALALLVSLTISGPALAQPERDPAAAAAPAITDPRDIEPVLEGREYQTELPGHDAEAGRARAEGRTPRRDGVLDSWIQSVPGSFLKAVVWALLLVGVGAVLWTLIRSSGPSPGVPARAPKPPRRRGGVGPSEASTPLSPSVAPTASRATSWSEVEPLAERGEWTAALKLLLPLVVTGLGRRLPAGDATTGRELLGRARWSPEEEHALEQLVRAAERVVFAGRPATAQDFDTARAAARRLVEPS